MKFKLILDQRYTRADNRHPLKLRIYEGGSYRERSLRMFLLDEEWDLDNQIVRKACKSHALCNSKLNQEKADLEKKILFNIDPPSPPKRKTKHSNLCSNSFNRYTCFCLRCHQRNSIFCKRAALLGSEKGYLVQIVIKQWVFIPILRTRIKSIFTI